MSWLRVALDVADIAMRVQHYRKMEDLKTMQQASEMIGVLQQLERDILSKISREKDALLLHREKEALAVATGILYLEKKFGDQGLTSDIFIDPADKNYFVSIEHSVRKARADTIAAIPQAQQQLVETTASALEVVDEITYLVTHHRNAGYLRETRAKLQRHRDSRPGTFSFGKEQWYKREQELLDQITDFQKGLDEDEFARLDRKHGERTWEEYIQLQEKMQKLIDHVFQNVPVPDLTINIPDIEHLGVASVNSSQERSDDRIPCPNPNCDYLNSKHRVTCKKCRTSLS